MARQIIAANLLQEQEQERRRQRGLQQLPFLLPRPSHETPMGQPQPEQLASPPRQRESHSHPESQPIVYANQPVQVVNGRPPRQELGSIPSIQDLQLPAPSLSQETAPLANAYSASSQNRHPRALPPLPPPCHLLQLGLPPHRRSNSPNRCPPPPPFYLFSRRALGVDPLRPPSPAQQKSFDASSSVVSIS